MPFRKSLSHIVGNTILAVAAMAVGVAAHAESRYTLSADGQEVTDTQTKLVWQRCAVGMKWNGKTCVGEPVLMTHSEVGNARKVSHFVRLVRSPG